MARAERSAGTSPPTRSRRGRRSPAAAGRGRSDGGRSGREVGDSRLRLRNDRRPRVVAREMVAKRGEMRRRAELNAVRRQARWSNAGPARRDRCAGPTHAPSFAGPSDTRRRSLTPLKIFGPPRRFGTPRAVESSWRGLASRPRPTRLDIQGGVSDLFRACGRLAPDPHAHGGKSPPGWRPHFFLSCVPRQGLPRPAAVPARATPGRKTADS